jgi:hypothetical protein
LGAIFSQALLTTQFDSGFAVGERSLSSKKQAMEAIETGIIKLMINITYQRRTLC